MYWATVLPILVGTMAATVSAQQPAHRNATQEGRRLALSRCDVCHIIARDQQYLPLLFHYALSFYDVASRPNTSLKSLEAFLAHPYSYETMPSPDLTPAQATDLAAYILSLGAGIDYSRQIGCGRHSGQERRVTPPAPHRIRQFWSH